MEAFAVVGGEGTWAGPGYRGLWTRPTEAVATRFGAGGGANCSLKPDSL